MKSVKNIWRELRCTWPLMSKGLSEFSRETTAIVLIALLALSSPVMINAEWVDRIIEVGVGGEYNDNINNSFFTSAEKDEFIFVPSFSVGPVYQATDFTHLVATVDAKGEIHQDLDGLNSVFVGTTLSGNHKLGIGPYKPWVRAQGSGGYLLVNDDLRDSWLFDAGIKAGKRLTDRVDVEAGYAFDFREAVEGDTVPGTNLPNSVFDQDGHTLSVLSNVLLTDSLLLSVGYAFRHGDIAATCTAAIVNEVIDKIDAVTFDETFEPAFNELPICAYKIRGNVHDFSVGTVYAISGNTSVNLTYNRAEGEASGLNYSNNRVNLSVKHSF